MKNLVQITETLAIPEEEIWFTAVRSSGPGGQHVNTTCSRVTLLFDLQASPCLSDADKVLVRQRLGRRIDGDGVLRVTVQTTRSQHRNKELALGRFAALLADALHKDPVRRPSRAPRAVKERILETKRRRSALKHTRRGGTGIFD